MKTNQEKGNFALKMAEAHFQRLGYMTTTQKDCCHPGVDLFTSNGAKSFSVEVKFCSNSQRAWRVKKVLRPNEDLIAIVFPSGYVHVDSMKDHLKLCGANGIRCLTNIAKLYT